MTNDIFDTRYEEQEVELSQNLVSLGDQINLNEKDPGINHILVGVGWDLNEYRGDPVDLDVSVFLLGADDMTRQDEDFIFYNQPEANGVVHKGDNRTGAGEGDDEVVSIALNDLPLDVSRIVFVLSIYDAEQKAQNLTSVNDGFIRISHANGHEILRYELSNDIQGHQETAMTVADLMREGPKWYFRPQGEYYAGGLSEVAQKFGIVIAGI